MDVKQGARVKFADRAVRQYAEEIAQDEINHVRFLRTVLGDYAVPRPHINLTTAFDAAAKAAGVDQDGRFDPFASDLAFLLGSFIFEDVGVTAYKGGAALINSDTYLDAAGSILAVEAYHAGLIRSTLYGIGGAAIDAANKIAGARNSLNPDVDNDQGIEVDGRANLVPTDENSIVFGRSTQQVHNIAYLTARAGRDLRRVLPRRHQQHQPRAHHQLSGPPRPSAPAGDHHGPDDAPASSGPRCVRAARAGPNRCAERSRR